MSAKDKKSDVFSYFKNVKCEYLARSLFWKRTKKFFFQQNYCFFEQRAFKHIFASVWMQMCACL